MARQQYGVTPWGAWFIDVLDSYSMGERLERGRRYANAGKVLSTETKGGTVSAKIAGNYRPFYKVSIAFSPLNEAECETVFSLIEESPAILSRIAFGELPEELLDALKKRGIDLIPKRWGDMKRSCNCPDYGDPCKHMAALYYIIAREIDDDPHTLFKLRGIDLTARFGSRVEHAIVPPFVITENARLPASGTGNDAGSHEIPENEPEFPPLPHCAGIITSLLPANPPFAERDFAITLAEFYHRAARHTPWIYIHTDDGIEHDFSRSVWTVEALPASSSAITPATPLTLVQESVAGEKKRYSVYDAFLFFRGFASDDGTRSYRYLFFLFKFLNLLCAAGAYIPAPFVPNENDEKGTKAKNSESEKLFIVWKPFDALNEIRAALDAISAYEDCMFAVQKAVAKKTSGYVSARSVTDLLCAAALSEWAHSVDFAPAGAGDIFSKLCAAFFRGKPLVVDSPATRSLPLAIDRWLSVLHTDFSAWKYRMTLKAASTKADSAKDESLAAFKITMDVMLENGAVPLKDAAKKTGSIDVLRAMTALSNYLPEITSLTRRTSVALSEPRLAAFLDEASNILSRLGIEVAFPKNLRRELKPRMVIKAEAKKTASLVSYFNLNTLLNWEWQVAIGDEVLTAKEFAQLVKQKTAVVRFRDKFVRLDPDELASLLRQAQSAKQPTTSDFLQAHFSGDSLLSVDAEAVMQNLFAERNFSCPAELHADLREYQTRGFNWVCSLLYAGFGCVLADDMGLGKTVQAISVLLHFAEQKMLADKCLVIAPAALLENWERELARFAPSLKMTRYHGTRRTLDAESDVYLTTYQTVVRDAEKLSERAFSLLIVDEAHLMKNAETRGAKTVKLLHAERRLALSGTPVENRLEDMRSLFDFVLPGYLGSAKDFKETYRVPIEVMRSKETAEKLKKITQPFLLRRLKTDRAIIQDLPDKIVVNEYASLEKGQAALYESIVAESLKKSAEMEDGGARSALILALLTALKQVCDHPRVYDKESPAKAELSGKALMLMTLLPEMLANREKVLIFSQYVETLTCLDTMILNELGERSLLYHGGLPQKTRSAVIDQFQTDPASRILLVSLKAGGLGLNLTAASRVVHYDLWYNPAVENQATDRAFRIGQTKNVFVHRFITKNSFEEKIDKMLTDKRELADLTISSGETWLSRMGHDELKALFS